MSRRSIGTHAWIILLGITLLLGACETSATPAGGPSTEEPTAQEALPEPDLPVPENTRERTRRLLDVERATDGWFIASQRQEYQSRDNYERLLRTYTADHFDAIVSDLKHGNQRYRRAMSAALGFSGRPEAVEPLIQALQDQYYEVVLHALLSLYHLAKDGIPFNPEAVAPYLGHPRPEVRSNAALALAQVVGPDSPPSLRLALISACQDSDAATRVHAAAALGALGDPEAFPHLVNALNDPVQLVRIRAILAMGHLKVPESVPYLIEVLERPKEKDDVKKSAAKALSILTNRSDCLSTDPEVWIDLLGIQAEGQ